MGTVLVELCAQGSSLGCIPQGCAEDLAQPACGSLADVVNSPVTVGPREPNFAPRSDSRGGAKCSLGPRAVTSVGPRCWAGRSPLLASVLSQAVHKEARPRLQGRLQVSVPSPLATSSLSVASRCPLSDGRKSAPLLEYCRLKIKIRMNDLDAQAWRGERPGAGSICSERGSCAALARGFWGWESESSVYGAGDRWAELWNRASQSAFWRCGLLMALGFRPPCGDKRGCG